MLITQQGEKVVIKRTLSELENIWAVKELEREELLELAQEEGRTGSVVKEEIDAVFSVKKQRVSSR